MSKKFLASIAIVSAFTFSTVPAWGAVGGSNPTPQVRAVGGSNPTPQVTAVGGSNPTPQATGTSSTMAPITVWYQVILSALGFN